MPHYIPTKKNELYEILENAAKFGVLSDPMQIVDAMFNFFSVTQIEEFVQHLKDDELIASDNDDEDDDDMNGYKECGWCNHTMQVAVNGDYFCPNCENDDADTDDDGSDCGVDCLACGMKLDRDCDGNIRCPECDGPCPCCAD